jgi:protoporphyrinogen oxidase
MQWKTLAVDLDGTLIRSDMLIETGFAYLKANPLCFYRPLVWIAQGGKAHLKAKLAAATHVDVATLPYDPKVIEVFIDKVKQYLKRINPALTDDDFIDVRASRYRYAQPICEPDFLDRLPPIQLPVKGLLVADTSYYYPEDRGISESIGLSRKMAKMI